MIDHMSTYATDFETTRAFYQAVLPVLGHTVQADFAFEHDPDLPGRHVCGFGRDGKPVFWIIETKDAATPRHVAFAAVDREAVAKFHQAGLAAGGIDNGAPGLRPEYHEDYFGSFLLDPDGNNVEAVCHTAER